MAMKRWLRRTLRRYGIHMPFADVVCPEHVKSIRVGADARVDVTVRRVLVFLDRPEPGDLRDHYPIDPATDGVIHESADAQEVQRTTTPAGTFVEWFPREPIVPYALSLHEHGWSSAGAPGDTAMYSEFHCDMRTGSMRLEISTPEAMETAVAFKRPRWRRLSTKHTLMKYALRQLESDAERPAILDDGLRLEWSLSGPKVGDRYVCVAFHQDGVALWRKRLEAASLAGRMRHALKALAPS
jgi:hypothetical protein